MRTIKTARSLAGALLAGAVAAPFPALGQGSGTDLQLAPVVVTAPRTEAPLEVETTPKNPRMPVPPNDGAGYLKSIPGFAMIRKGGIDGDPLFRGQSGSRLNVLIDGSPLMGGCGMRMDPPTAYVFPESFDRITVLKGPQSVIHGGSAPGATVLIERTTRRFAEPGVRGDASALAGSYGRNDQLLDAAAGTPDGYVRAIGTRSHSDDYRDGSGNRVHSAYNRYSGALLAGWTPDADTTLEGSAEISRARAAYADRMMDGTKFDRESYRLRFRRENLSPLVAKAQATLSYDYVDHVMDRFTLRPWTGGTASALNNPDRTGFAARTSAELTPSDRLTLTVGLDAARDLHGLRTLSAAEFLRGVGVDGKKRVLDMSFTTIGGFAEAALDLAPGSRLIGGYRLNHVTTERLNVANPPRAAEALHNAFARYEHDVDLGLPVTAYAGIGYTERAPDYWERTRAFALKPERAAQVDVGALHRSERWRGSVALFATSTADYILLSSTTGRNVDAAMLGGEAEAEYRVAPSWTVEASLAYVWGQNRSDDRPLPQMPPLEGRVGLRYDDGEFLAGALTRLAAAQKRYDIGWGNIVGTDVGANPAFATVSLNVGWRPKDGLLLAAGVDNLFDTTYAESVSRAGSSSLMAAGYPTTMRVNEPGRTIWVKGKLTF
ncbi:MAG TPA: TonB-dependent copper receptor [Azospirillum sp.]|nr:TonB-dependent copper receptor [Azospirillum sp.]